MCIKELSDITKRNTRMSVVCFGDYGVDPIELQILTRWVCYEVYIIFKNFFKKEFQVCGFYEYQTSLSLSPIPYSN